MSRFAAFDLLQTPLAGVNLVEASAGTGKTYSITGLYLRLIAEQDLDVASILVVTFTEAATQELKDRVRRRLAEAVAVFQSGRRSDDAFLEGLRQQLAYRREAAGRSLERALRGFDRASIFTIHGFCRRILSEYAFESGLVFDAEVVTSQEDLKREIAADFWRNRFYRSAPLFVRHAVMERKLSPEKLALLISGQRLSPELRVRPHPKAEKELELQQQSLEKTFANTFVELTAEWSRWRSAIIEILEHSPALNRQRYNKKAVAALISDMDAYTEEPCGVPGLFTNFERFTTDYMTGSLKKGHTAVEHEFFDCCQAHQTAARKLSEILDLRVAAVKAAFIAYARTELGKRKANRNLLYFDDLILNLHRALRGDSGKWLARIISRRFPAALIDEFQDTDTVQYDIFSTIFRGRARALFLIGDPKQAIYGFRGADIFAYLQAVQETETAYTLAENWRSAPALVHSVNRLFQDLVDPFIYRSIRYYAVRPSGAAEIAPFIVDGIAASGLEIRLLEADNFPETATIDEWRSVVAADTADQIARLLEGAQQGTVLLSGRPLVEADIAVLVRKNDEAELIQKHLRRRGVYGIILKTGNVFDTHEAFELQVLLEALAFADDEKRIRAALATDMLGGTAADIDRLNKEEYFLEARLADFGRYREQWQRRGFMRMMMGFLHREAVLPRLMNFSDGERRCTNLFHLAELLHQASLQEASGPVTAGLLQWLRRRRHSRGEEAEEHQLRLASDDQAVKIITIHKSKGLQYPVVFCPFLWTPPPRGTSSDEAGVLFHDESDRRTLTLDFYPGDHPEGEAGRHLWERERFAEEMRLLYVALTRARNRCQVPVVPDKAGNTALWNLLTRGKEEDLAAHLAKAGEGVTVSYARPGEGGPYFAARPELAAEVLACRFFSGEIRQDWRVMSFSAMRGAPAMMEESFWIKRDTAGPGAAAEAADGRMNQAAVMETGMAGFPRGAAAGLCLHELLEHLDFTCTDEEYRRRQVAIRLGRYNFDLCWQEAVCGMLGDLLAVELAPGGGGCLGTLSGRERLNELEFYFPLNRVSPDILADIYRRTYAAASMEGFVEEMGRLRFSPARGYMHGFMDMVFRQGGRYFLLDWKSNYLGPGVEAYTVDRLEAVMQAEYYLLQSHIYTVALHCYLQRRLPGYRYADHFGGAYYVFLRGLSAAAGPGCGLYFEKPPEGFVREFTRELVRVAGE